MSIDQWSTTAANNASGVTGINWAEGQAPSTVNDSARELMAQIAAWRDWVFTTGDVKLTLKTTADAGWVLMNDGTIGDASSGATTRANADTSALFALLWNNTADAECPVSTGRGANAAADFAAHKTITLPLSLGRALACYGSGSGLTARALAKTTGAETVTLTAAESGSVAHTHTASSTLRSSDGGGTGSSTFASNFLTTALTGAGAVNTNYTDNVVITTTSANAGASASNAHTNMQPTLFLNVMIKL